MEDLSAGARAGQLLGASPYGKLASDVKIAGGAPAAAPASANLPRKAASADDGGALVAAAPGATATAVTANAAAQQQTPAPVKQPSVTPSSTNTWLSKPPAAPIDHQKATVKPQPTATYIPAGTFGSQQAAVSYDSLPSCQSSLTKINSLPDKQGRFLGWNNDKHCVFRGAAKPAAVKGSPRASSAAAAAVPAAALGALGGGAGAGGVRVPTAPSTAWQTAPACAGTASASNSVKDKNGLRWGWENKVSCAFREGYAVIVGWDEAPICTSTPTVETVNWDKQGQAWGVENGYSCAFRVSVGLQKETEQLAALKLAHKCICATLEPLMACVACLKVPPRSCSS